MTEDRLRELGREMMAEEALLLLKVAMQTASPKEIERYKEVHGQINEIEARLWRMGGDGAGLVLTSS